MFELTNEQRACFGLRPVEQNWVRLELHNPPAWCTAVVYLEGTVVRKYIETGERTYTEYEVFEQLSDDLRCILPKTAKGKPVVLTASSMEKRKGIGMCLSFWGEPEHPANIALYSLSSEKVYYTSEYERVDIADIGGFQQWVEQWCDETTEDDLAEIAHFAALPRQHVKFREGDVFRFRIDRRTYGYGRILLDYAKLRKQKAPFWDPLCGKPLVCSVYHMLTARRDVSAEELKGRASLPSVHMMDNHLYYGSYEIVGHIPIGAREDYPIRYGRRDLRSSSVQLQCGKLYCSIENAAVLARGFSNQAVGFGLQMKRDVLLACVARGSNAPYWAREEQYGGRDLRDPRFRGELERVCRQFGLTAEQLLGRER